MNRQRDTFYLTIIARAVQRLATRFEKHELFNELHLSMEETEKDYACIIDEAESLASGIFDKEHSLGIPATSMTSLLASVGNNVCGLHHFTPSAISLTKDCFPKQGKEQKADEAHLVNQLQANIKNLQKNNPHVLADNLLQLLFRYASFIPANALTPDVSLYDQTRVASAIGVCLFDVKQEHPLNPEKPMLLIGADFSGIQSYIYQIVSKHAGKNLKGRSFYLRLLSDAVLGCLIKRLNLYNANIIYDSGGCFYLLAPNTQTVKDALGDAVRYVEEQIFKAHQTSLYVAIESIEVSKEEIGNHSSANGLSNVWQALFAKRDKKKQNRFAQLMETSYSVFFTPKDVDGKKRDAITGNDFSKDDDVVKFNGDQLISRLNDQQIKLGQALKECDCIAVTESEASCWKERVSIQPAYIGRYYYLLSFKDVRNNAEFIREHADDVSIRLLNGRHGDCDYILPSDMTHCVVDLEFYGGNTFNGNTFEEMCDNDNLSRLGVLRMDVDNLGSIFQSGIPKEKASLTRYAALSRSFDYFFSGYINNIVLKGENTDKSFIVYSGGDDLFIVGEWNTVIRIAKTIREDFREYTCANPAFSISGGVAILTTKFPIIAGAEESAQEESNAKEHACHGKSKDSISFMDTPLNWNNEFPAVEKLKDRLVELLIPGELPKSFLSKILLHASMADIVQHKIKNVKTYWLMSYDMKRVIERAKSDNAKQLAQNCQKEIWENGNMLNGEPIATNYHLLELWAFACRWAELEYRMFNN